MNKNSCSYDLVSNRAIKATNEYVSPYLEILFQKCIMEGVFPDCYKIAQVIPLFKGGTKKIGTVTDLFLYSLLLVKFLRNS